MTLPTEIQDYIDGLDLALLSGENVREALSQALDDIAEIREGRGQAVLSNPPYTRPDAGEVG